jgi:hypothetical protein
VQGRVGAIVKVRCKSRNHSIPSITPPGHNGRDLSKLFAGLLFGLKVQLPAWGHWELIFTVSSVRSSFGTILTMPAHILPPCMYFEQLHRTSADLGSPQSQDRCGQCMMIAAPTMGHQVVARLLLLTGQPISVRFYGIRHQ